MFSVFISYSHEDAAQAKEISRALESSEIQAWIDHANLRAGEKWPKALGEAIAKADELLLVWSKAAANSEFVELEWNIALALKTKIIPYVLDDTQLPAALRPLQALSGNIPRQTRPAAGRCRPFVAGCSPSDVYSR